MMLPRNQQRPSLGDATQTKERNKMSKVIAAIGLIVSVGGAYCVRANPWRIWDAMAKNPLGR